MKGYVRDEGGRGNALDFNRTPKTHAMLNSTQIWHLVYLGQRLAEVPDPLRGCPVTRQNLDPAMVTYHETIHEPVRRHLTDLC